MNKIYKVIKGKVCSEYAKGAKKGAVGFTTLALAIMAANNSQAANTINNDAIAPVDPITILTGDGNTIDAKQRRDRDFILLSGDNNVLTLSKAVIEGSGNTLTTSPTPELLSTRDGQVYYINYFYLTGANNTANSSSGIIQGDYNTLNNTSGTVVGDVNRITNGRSINVIGRSNELNVTGAELNGSVNRSNVLGNSNTINISTRNATVVPGANSEAVVAVGNGNKMIGDNTVTLGNDNEASGARSIAIGFGSTANSTRAITETNPTPGAALAIGTRAYSSNESSMAIGNKATALTEYSIAIGDSASSGHFNTIAIGKSAASFGENGVSIGANAKGQGVSIGAFSNSSLSAVAVGISVKAQEMNALALGSYSSANKEESIAIGTAAHADGVSAIAMGGSSSSDGEKAVGIGYGNIANGDNSIAIGSHSKATSVSSIAIGTRTSATVDKTIAIGTDSHVYGLQSIGIGNNNNIRGVGNIALGNNITADTHNAVILGDGSTATGAVGSYTSTFGGTTTAIYAGGTPNGVVSIGSVGGERQLQNVAAGQISATSTDAINGSQLNATNTIFTNRLKYFGTKSTDSSGNPLPVRGNENGEGATGDYSVAIGAGASASGYGAVALGSQTISNQQIIAAPTAEGNNSFAAGQATKAKGDFSTAMGYFTTASGYTSTAMGLQSQAIGDNSLATNGAVARAQNSIAMGKGAITGSSDNSTERAIAIGENSQALADNTIAIGTGNVVSGAKSGAFGDPNTVAGTGSYAFGNDNTINQDNTFVLGNNVTTTQANSVVLGNNSTDSAAVAVAGYAGSTPVGVVSVGSVGGERQVKNVAAGQLSSTSTDAVNGSQLNAVDQASQTRDNNLQGNINTLQDNINTTNATIAKGINFGGTTGSNNYQLGDTINVKGDNNINSTTVAGGTQLALNPNLTLNSVTTGGVVLSSNGLDNGGNTIRNVGNAVNGTDAVNLNQLNAVAANAKTTSVVGGTNIASVTAKVDGVNTEYTINAKGTSLAAGSDAVTVTSTTDADNTTNYITDLSDATKASLIKADSALQSISSTNANILVGAKDVNGNQAITLSDNPAFAGTVTAPVFSTGVNAPTLSTTGLDAANTKITNVKDGAITADSKDAVNGGQLYALTEKVNNLDATDVVAGKGTTVTKSTQGNLNTYTVSVSDETLDNIAKAQTDAAKGIADAKAADDKAVAAQTTANTAVTKADAAQATADKAAEDIKALDDIAVKYDTTTKDTVTLGGADGTTITNVKDGAISADSKDAVNGGQLFATNQTIADNKAAQDAKNAQLDATNAAQDAEIAKKADQSALDATNAKVKANTDAIAKGFNVKTSDATSTNYQLGDTVSILGGKNIDTKTTTDGITVSLKDDIAVKTIAIDGSNVGLSAAGVNAGNLKVTGVADGAITADSKDAVNGSQLHAVKVVADTAKAQSDANTADIARLDNQKADKTALDATNDKLNALDNAAVKYDDPTAKDKVTLGGADGTTITNVKAGAISANSTDAVNGSQLFDVYNYVNQGNDAMRQHIDTVEDKLQAGIAGSNASAALPQVRGNGKSMMAFGLGGFQDKGALAVGYSRSSDNGRTVFKAHLNADTENQIGGGIGLGFEW